MAFKLVLLVAVCFAQGLAFGPLRLPHNEANVQVRDAGCSSSSQGSFALEVEQTVDEFDALREEVSLAAMEAYATGKDMKIAVACFVQQSPNYIKMGVRLAHMMNEATKEMAGKLQEKAGKYAERMAGPVKELTVTFTTVPVKVYIYIQNKQFLKAARLMLEARKVIKKNSIILAEAFVDMAAEVPELADRAEELAKEIYETTRERSQVIRAAFAKCVEQGGPKRPVEEEEDFLEE